MEILEVISSNKVGFIVAAIVLLIYVLYPSKIKKNELSDGIIVATSALGAFGGLKVFVFAIVMVKCNVGKFEIEQIYVFLGGVAMIWISLEGIFKKFKDKIHSQP